jgi:hypothetical protein
MESINTTTTNNNDQLLNLILSTKDNQTNTNNQTLTTTIIPLLTNPKQISYSNHFTNVLLAAFSCHLPTSTIEQILKNHHPTTIIDLNFMAPDGRTPIYDAINNGYPPSIIQTLLEMGTDPNFGSFNAGQHLGEFGGWNSLCVCVSEPSTISNKTVFSVQLLLMYGCNPHYKKSPLGDVFQVYQTTKLKCTNNYSNLHELDQIFSHVHLYSPLNPNLIMFEDDISNSGNKKIHDQLVFLHQQLDNELHIISLDGSMKHPQYVLDDFKHLSMGGDFMFHTTTKSLSIPVHMEVLKSRSCVWNKMFTVPEFKETSTSKEIFFNVSNQVLQLFVTFLYSSLFIDRNSVQDLSILIPLLILSNMYDIKSLRRRVSVSLACLLTCDNVIELWKLGELHESPLLTTRCIAFMRRHLMEMRPRRDWLEELDYEIREYVGKGMKYYYYY